MKKTILILFIIYSSLSFIFAQSSEPIIKTSCEALVVCAYPQMLAGKSITKYQMQDVLNQAKKDKIILEDGKVVNREAMAGLVLKTLGRTEIVVTFGSEPSGRGKHVGYLLELSNKNGSCFVLTGIDKEPLYNPCNFKGSVISALEVFVYAK